MRRQLRILVAVLLVMMTAALAAVLILRDTTPPGGKELKKLAGGFMKSLPEGTTDAQRDEIQGIMDRFYRAAMKGTVDPQDITEIESDLRKYIGQGGIPKDELFGFTSKVGKATRAQVE